MGSRGALIQILSDYLLQINFSTFLIGFGGFMQIMVIRSPC